MKNWTPAQQAAIEAEHCSLAVSAAAGSGKTSVLTHRILRLLSEPDGIDAARLAVVTFTKNAAEELEDRLFSALSEEAAAHPEKTHLTRQLLRLSGAQISTIHSFAFSLVKTYRRELGFGEKLRIADPAQSALLQRKSAEEAVENYFAQSTSPEEREGLYRLFGSARRSDGLTEAVLSIQKMVEGFPDSYGEWERLLSRAEKEEMALREGSLSFGDTLFGQEIRREALSLLRGAEMTLEALCEALAPFALLDEKYTPVFRERIEALKRAEALALDGDFFSAAREAERAFEKSLPRIVKCPPEESEAKENCSKIHNERVKKPLLKSLSRLFWQSAPEVLRDFGETLVLSRQLLMLSKSASERFSAEKKEKGLVDYADLERMTLSLLAEIDENGRVIPTPLREEISKKFDAVFVDEYQDTNRVQDLIFRLVSREDNLFLVGDPKQSIYRFRGAEPSIFSDYKKNLPPYREGCREMQKIFLSDNFRCDKSIIDAVNRIFTVMMNGEDPESLYQIEDRLRHSKKSEPHEEEFPVELVLVDRKSEEEEAESPEELLSREESREAAYLASEIAALLQGKRSREAFLPEKVAVICRTRQQIAKVQKALEARGIPADAPGEESLRESGEYLFMTSLLAALDNPSHDIPLLGILSSPVFRFSPDALFRIRKENRAVPFYTALRRYRQEGTHGETVEKCAFVLDTLRELREKARSSSLPALLFEIYRRFCPDLIWSEGQNSGAVREFLYACAKSAESAEISSLGEFCRFLEKTDLPEGTSSQGGVRLMTIHKSKGLEFDAVFVSFLAQPFNRRDESNPLVLSRRFGAVCSLPRLEGRARMNTLMRSAAVLHLHEEMIEEEKRVLYVALTRAKRKLVLTASPRSFSAAAAELLLFSPRPLSNSLLGELMRRAASPLSLILLSLRDMAGLREVLTREASRFEGALTVRREIAPPFEAAKNAASEEEITPIPPEEALATLAFRYREQDLERLPAKLSVSQILRQGREESAEFTPHRLLDFEHATLRSTPLAIGNATHRVMQFADFAALAHAPEAEFCRLTERGFVSEEDMALAQKDRILAFFDHPLGREMLASPALCREKRFNVLLSAEAIGVGSGEVLVQGVVDAWFENPDGSLTLVDFKTDRVSPANGADLLRERYADQLRLYRLAVEELTEKPVSRLLLYSFALGDSVFVPLHNDGETPALDK
ncbi:MAG: UvrD-helicase domain-containing protein [Clostridia bacterium]|nr:UvrD-helicase domain-containing protein [Clostridia bacterium]